MHWDAENLSARPAPYSPLPFLHLSPKQTCKSPPGLQLSDREEKIRGGGEREAERERGERTGDRRWQKDERSVRLGAGVTGPWGQQGTISLQKRNRKIKDGATLTSIVNNICQQMSYGAKRKQLLWKGDKGSLLQKEVESVGFVRCCCIH